MFDFKCDICGGNLIIKSNSNMGICENCGAKELVDKKDFEKYNDSYHAAVRDMNSGTIAGYKSAAEIFEEIPFMYDSKIRYSTCIEKIDELEADKKAERTRAAEFEKQSRRKKTFKKAARIIAVFLIAIAAISAFIVIKQVIPSKLYDKAIDNIYEINTEKIEYYRSSALKLNDSAKLAEKFNVAAYSYSKELAEDENYKDAISLLSLIAEYNDSGELIKEYTKLLNEQTYSRACDFYSKGKYKQALKLFQNLGNYKESKSYVNKLDVIIERIRISGFNVGDTLTFGQYNISEKKEKQY